MTAATPHLLMSVSKSLVGCVAGILAGRGLLDPEAPVSTYVPEVAGAGYGGATVRDLLDMRTGVPFSETYTDPDAEVRVMERSMGWRPRRDGDPVGSLRLPGHAGPASSRTAGRSPTGPPTPTCSAGSASGPPARRMADLVSSLLWLPMGAEHDAEITCDSVGHGDPRRRHLGGRRATWRGSAGCCSTTDGRRARGGPGVLAGRGAGPRRPTSARRSPHRTTRRCCPAGGTATSSGSCRTPRGDALVCLGIHGQMVYVNRETGPVGVKLSSLAGAAARRVPGRHAAVRSGRSAARFTARPGRASACTYSGVPDSEA